MYISLIYHTFAAVTTTPMKKTLIALTALITAVAPIIAQQNMYVWKSDGTYDKYHVSTLDSIGFYMDDMPPATVGVFSVSETQQVMFSTGNLQYQASTKTWRFAENQWDFIGAPNKNVSSTYSGWIDLFGLGTGDAPTRTSTKNSKYPSFVDWGVNTIYDGDTEYESGIWYTLSIEEWKYLFETRNNADKLYAQGTVRGVGGMIILPDNWTLPDELSFTPGIEDGFSNNSYNANQWQLMESAGAVFLPDAGDLHGKTILHNAGVGGYYWSSSPKEDGQAYNIYFYSGYFHVQSSFSRYYARSVRLVRPVPR